MKTTKLLLTTIIAAALFASCSNSGSYSSTNASLKSEKDSVSFYIGYFFGNNLASMQMNDVNMEALIAGINSATQKKELDTDMYAMQAAIMSYSQKLVAKVADENLKKGQEFLEKNAKKSDVQTLENGVQYKVITAAEGRKPIATEKVRVHYVGTLIDGTEFDSSIKRGEPAEFGLNQVIPGWTSALQEMAVGAKWIIYIPAELGYGARGAGQDIGPNETLIFEVELLDIVE